jgi:outer membrane protein assembly factor BamB
MKTSGKLLVLLAGLSVSASVWAADTGTDWRQMGFSPKGNRSNPHETALNASNVANLSVAWTAQTGDVIRSSPAIVNGVVYAGSYDGKLYAWDEASGVVKWSADAPGIRNSAPAVMDGFVCVASNDGALYAFHTESGAPVWTAKLRRFSVSSPTIAHGVVYVSSAGVLFAFDARTGTLKWRVRAGGTFTPAVVDGVVYGIAGGSSLRAFNAETGAVIWKTKAPVVSSPAFANGRVYAVYANTSTDYGVYAFDAATGSRLWHSPFGGFSQSDLAVANGIVYAGSFDGNLYAFDALTGARKWAFKVGTEVDVAPAVANGVAYAASTEDGVVYGLDASTGAPLWNAPTTGNFMFSSPSIVNGMLFVGSDDGKLYAFGLSGARSQHSR